VTRSSKILLVEDDPNDVELTLSALARNRLSDEIAVVRDGQEALDYLFRRGTTPRGKRPTRRWCS
jgi:CheY-like chemotaxis protein